MTLNRAAAEAQIKDELFPALRAERERVERIDRWYRWEHEEPRMPKDATREYKELAARAKTPWLGLVVTSVAQALYVDGYRAADATEESSPWAIWQANGMDSHQIAIHRAALAYGLAYLKVLPGEDAFGEPMAVMTGVDPSQMVAFYANPARDVWPVVALEATPAKVNGQMGFALKLYDDTQVHFLQCHGDGSGLTWIENRDHAVGVCPVVRFANMLDLRGRTPGEVEPFIPVAARIDQTTFDRLVVQRFAAWVVRTISGMAMPEDVSEERAKALLLKVSDLLVAEDPDTKFGHLPATPLDGFIAAYDADVRSLAAVSQTPPHHLLGQMANLSAEALAAAEASLSRKVVERQQVFGEAYEQALRLAARIIGDIEAARDTASQVRWRDMESRSLAQAADALGKLAQMLQVPVELLWEKIPGWTQQDVERARELVAQGGGIEALLRELALSQTSPPSPGGGA